MLRIYNTKYTNKIGNKSYPIHLLVSNATREHNSDLHFDLQCKYEIYAIAWSDIYEESVKDYYEGKLEEVK